MIYSNIENKKTYNELENLKNQEIKYSFNLRGWRSKIDVELDDALKQKYQTIYNLINYELIEIKRRIEIIESELFFKYKLISTEMNLQKIKDLNTNIDDLLIIEVQKSLPVSLSNNKKGLNEAYIQWGIDLEGVLNSATSLHEFILNNKYYRIIDTSVNSNIDVQNEISSVLGINIIINTLTIEKGYKKLNEQIIYNEKISDNILSEIERLTIILDESADEISNLWMEAVSTGLIDDITNGIIQNFDERWIIEIGKYLKETFGKNSLSDLSVDNRNILKAKKSLNARKEFIQQLKNMNDNKIKTNFDVNSKQNINVGLEKSIEFSKSKFELIFPKGNTDAFYKTALYPTFSTILDEDISIVKITCVGDTPIIIDLI